MRLASVWSIVTVSLLALPVAAGADARDYPTHVTSAAHSGRGPHGGGSHFHGRLPSRRSTIVFLPPYYSSFYDAPPAYASPPPYAPPPVIYAPTVSYGAPTTAYGPPQTAYAPPPAPSVPPPPPMPRSVEFGSGRYELRGDGMTSPYVWVWIPNPPTAPPPGFGAPSTPAALYRWTDERGVTTWTDSLEKVPARFRASAAQTLP
jgi:hypothetical protein